MSASFRRRKDARDALIAMTRADKHCRVVIGPEPGRELPYRIAEVWRRAA